MLNRCGLGEYLGRSSGVHLFRFRRLIGGEAMLDPNKQRDGVCLHTSCVSLFISRCSNTPSLPTTSSEDEQTSGSLKRIIS